MICLYVCVVLFDIQYDLVTRYSYHGFAVGLATDIKHNHFPLEVVS